MSRRLLACLAAGATALAVAAEERAVGGSIEVGFDSFVQRYRFTDSILGEAGDTSVDRLVTQRTLRDSTEVFNELRTQAILEFRDEGPSHRFELRGRLSGGTELIREGADLDLRYGGGERPGRLDLRASIDLRQFREGGDYALSSDVVEFDARAHARRKVGDDTELGLRVRGGTESYETPSVFERDERRLDASATLGMLRGLDFLADFELGGGYREIPDSNAISHQRLFAFADLSQLAGAWNFRLTSRAERRVYEDANARSPYWDLLFEPEIGRDLDDFGVWNLSLASAMEWLRYDDDSDIYVDGWFGRVGPRLTRRAARWSAGLEPRWSWLAGDESVDDRYGQASVVLRFDWYGGGRLWLSVSEEIGRRDYAEEDELSLYSDYTFARTTLLASLRLGPRLSLDGFLSDEPESHRRSEDDGRLTLASLSLRYRF